MKKNYNQNWTKAYNKAADREDPNLARINKKYEKYDFRTIDDNNKEIWNQYVHEISDSWVQTYSDVLLEDFGSHPTMGKDWVEYAPFMNMYDEYYQE